MRHMGLVHGLVGLTAADWQAIGSVGTLVVAVVAALYARSQVKVAQAVRADQSQPQVVVDFGLHLGFMVEIVISNIGTTTARNVKLSFNPPLASTFENPQDPFLASRILTEGIPTLPPGKEYHILFENGNARYNAKELPASYEATAKFQDNRERLYEEKYILDFRLYYDYIITPNDGLHEVSKSLEKIQKTLNGWNESGKLSVISRDGDKRDAQMREWVEQRRAEQDGQKAETETLHAAEPDQTVGD